MSHVHEGAVYPGVLEYLIRAAFLTLTSQGVE